jgi:hypothetical protein
VTRLKTEPKCKLCQHPKRDDIDALLERRSQREKDENGVLINGDYVLAVLAEWGVVNPTKENIGVHWRKHCERITGGKGEEIDAGQQAALEELIEILQSGEYADNMDGQLERLWDLGLAEVKRRIMRGDSSGITLDQMRWIAGERTRRRDNESRNDLLTALTQGIATAEITAVKAVVSARPAIPVETGNELVAEPADFEEVEHGS